MKRAVLKVIHGIEFLFVMFVYFISFPLAFLLYGRKHYWLISEVDFDARDNGYHFFKYLSKNHKEINSIYLISKNNPYFSRISDIGKTLEPKTYKHLLIFIAAQCKLSTLVHGCSPNSYLTKYLIKHHSTGKNIALKHGIFKNIHPNYFKENAHLDLICCGNKPEFEFVDSNFHYKKGVAQYTGLARFDALHDFEVKKQILVMPTWRRWLDGVNSDKQFINSEFFKAWNSFFHSDFVSSTSYEIAFFIHPKINKHIGAFGELPSNVKVYSSTKGDSLQELLKSSAILITDYSSVFYDFAYMKKPSLYYQFDEKQYFAEHYEKAFFDYRTDGYGPVVSLEERLLFELNKMVNGGPLDDRYLSRINGSFVLNDKNNCERIYQSIVSLLQ